MVRADAYDRVVSDARNGSRRSGSMLQALHGVEEPGPAGVTDGTGQRSGRLTALVEVLERIRKKGEKASVFREFLDLEKSGTHSSRPLGRLNGCQWGGRAVGDRVDGCAATSGPNPHGGKGARNRIPLARNLDLAHETSETVKGAEPVGAEVVEPLTGRAAALSKAPGI